MSGQEQGAGKHGHKDTEEPWPHHGQSGSQTQDGGQGESGSQAGSRESRDREGGSQSQSGSQGGSGSQGSGGDESFQAREYRDKDGSIHHHTMTYMEQHDKGSEK